MLASTSNASSPRLPRRLEDMPTWPRTAKDCGVTPPARQPATRARAARRLLINTARSPHITTLESSDEGRDVLPNRPARDTNTATSSLAALPPDTVARYAKFLGAAASPRISSPRVRSDEATLHGQRLRQQPTTYGTSSTQNTDVSGESDCKRYVRELQTPFAFFVALGGALKPEITRTSSSARAPPSAAGASRPLCY